MTTKVDKTVVVNVPLSTVYNRLFAFEGVATAGT